MAFGPLTGAAMNPARVLGPALASGHWAHHLVFWVGPLAGAAIAAAVYEFVVAGRRVPVPTADVAADALPDAA
jgi:glycerol uptake facilitator-like aquaporin